MKTFHIKGRVFSGKGEGGKFIKLPWVSKQIAEKLGFAPYPGTLNIRLNKKYVKIKKLLQRTQAIEVSPVDDCCRGRCFHMYFMDNLKCAIVIPSVENYPEDVIEIIAPINMRAKFKLKDGDMIEIQIVT